MITIRQFLGALLSEITRARVVSDTASAAIANRYLDHEILKSFPIPRMHIRDLEVEMSFAVAPGVQGVSVYSDEAVWQNVRLQLEAFLRALPDDPALQAAFASDGALRSRWAAAVGGIAPSFEKALSQPGTARERLTRTLSLLIENLVLDLALRTEASELLSRAGGAGAAGDVPSLDGSLVRRIRDAVSHILTSVDPADAEAEALGLFDLNVLVTAEELEKVPPQSIHSLKLLFQASDRRWVVADQDGEKRNILTRD